MRASPTFYFIFFLGERNENRDGENVQRERAAFRASSSVCHDLTLRHGHH